MEIIAYPRFVFSSNHVFQSRIHGYMIFSSSFTIKQTAQFPIPYHPVIFITGYSMTSMLPSSLNSSDGKQKAYTFSIHHLLSYFQQFPSSGFIAKARK